ncbi:hypothetical protein [Prevotella disiens]|uniref:Uncharacterized protein n=1 Tax=Prevotella disiens DNF00882 TaxID=1401075 RepID=A0A096AN70_9BACT|nr:hypothetical protein [Prevotella disiens]KGF48543.1 hypothetical protein HMPREF0654_08925 [Prevotella disiens DNF00882]
MDERKVQQEASEALLDVGVSVPLKPIRLPFRKKRLLLRLTMRRPRLSTQIKIARLYLSLGVTYAELEALDKDGQMCFIAEHGKTISDMVALTMCGKWWKPVWLVSWILRHWVENLYMQVAMMKFVLLLGTESFTNIIRSAEMTNPMKLRLSQKKKGS